MPSPAITRPGASALERHELRGEHGVGDEADPGHQRAEERALRRAAGGPSSVASAPRMREGRQRRPLGLADGPDVVVAEHAVHAGGDRRRGRGERRRRACRGTSAARRRSASRHKPALARRQRARRPHRPARRRRRARSPPAGAGRRPRPARRRWRGRTRAGGRPPAPRPPPSTKHSGSSTPARLARPKPTHHPTSSMTCWAAGSPAAAAAETSSPRTLSGSPPASRTTSPSRPARAASRARTPSPAPEAKRSQQPRRPHGHGGPGRVDHHVADLAGEARRADLDAPVDHDAAADAGAERDHDDVADSRGRRPGGARPARRSWRRSRSATVRPGSRSPISSVQSTPWAWGRLGAKHSRPCAVDHARRAHATGAASAADGGAERRAIEVGRPPRPRPSATWLPTIVAGPASGWRPGPRRRCRRRGSRATPRTLVPPMSMP